MKKLFLYIKKLNLQTMKRTYSDMDLIRLSVQDGAICLDKQFILLDNFDDAVRQNDAETFFANHPVKISFVTVIFCLSGCIRFQINLQNFELHSNDILIVQKGTIGEYCGMSNGTRMAVMAFMPEYFQITNQIEATMSLQRQLYVSPLCHLRQEEFEECMTIYRLMKAKTKQKYTPFRKGALYGYVQVLIYNAYSYLVAAEVEERKPKERTGRKQELYNRFIKEVQKSYTKERSISYYANELCVTPKYLSQVIHAVSGRFAGDWISDFVILEAKALLKSRKYTVQQVADMLHFANQSFFGVYFKKAVGCSPKAYQEEERW